jgi:hypothetical protein
MSMSNVDAGREVTLAERRYPAEHFLIYFKWYLVQLGLAALVTAYVFLRAQMHPRSDLWILGVILSSACGGLIVYIAYRQFRRTRWVELSPNTLTWEDNSGVHECPLSDIRDVYRSETVTTYNHMWAHHQLKVQVVMTEGRRLDLDLGVVGINELCDRLQHIAGINRSNGAGGESSESGESFGPLTVFQDGVLMKGRKYAWDDIRSYGIEDGYLTINPYMKKGCRAATFPLSRIPNYHYLLELLEARSGRTLTES